jgi:PAS domain S-box-containing protein
MVDMPNRKSATRTPRHSDERFRILYETNPASVVLLTVKGEPVDCNPACAKMFGYESRTQFVACAARDLFVKRADREQLLTHVRNGGSCRAVEIRLRRRNGKPIWTLVSASWTPPADGHPKLIQATMLDVSERKSAELQVRRVSEHILNLEEEDRRRIARKLQDSTSQELAALKMNLGVIKQSDAQLGPKATKALAECLALAEECAHEIRAFSQLLHPPLLDEFGLISALRTYLEGLRKRSGLRLALTVDKQSRRDRLPKELETTLFRVVQEGLSNVRLHSGSRIAEVELRREIDSGEIVLKVRDSGHGMPAKVTRARIRDSRNDGTGKAAGGRA